MDPWVAVFSASGPLTGTAPLVGIAMKEGYRQVFQTTNEFVRIKF
jgi:hypothetical protein